MHHVPPQLLPQAVARSCSGGLLLLLLLLLLHRLLPLPRPPCCRRRLLLLGPASTPPVRPHHLPACRHYVLLSPCPALPSGLLQLQGGEVHA